MSVYFTCELNNESKGHSLAFSYLNSKILIWKLIDNKSLTDIKLFPSVELDIYYRGTNMKNFKLKIDQENNKLYFYSGDFNTIIVNLQLFVKDISLLLLDSATSLENENKYEVISNTIKRNFSLDNSTFEIIDYYNIGKVNLVEEISNNIFISISLKGLSLYNSIDKIIVNQILFNYEPSIVKIINKNISSIMFCTAVNNKLNYYEFSFISNSINLQCSYEFNFPITTIEQINDNILILATENGIYKLNLITQIRKEMIKQNFKVNSILYYKNNDSLIIIGNDKSILFYDSTFQLKKNTLTNSYLLTDLERSTLNQKTVFICKRNNNSSLLVFSIDKIEFNLMN